MKGEYGEAGRGMKSKLRLICRSVVLEGGKKRSVIVVVGNGGWWGCRRGVAMCGVCQQTVAYKARH